jgi:hypothetical protein
MRQFESARHSFAMAEGLADGTTLDAGQVAELGEYMKGGWEGNKCPEGGEYGIGPVGGDVECSFHGPLSRRTHVPPKYAGTARVPVLSPEPVGEPDAAACPSAPPVEVDEIFRDAPGQAEAERMHVGARASALLARRVVLRRPCWVTLRRGVVVSLLVPDDPKWHQKRGGEIAGVHAAGTVKSLSLARRELALECRPEDLTVVAIE